MIAPGSSNLEVGIGRLLSRSIDPEVVADPAVVLVATEASSDLYLDGRGWLWWSGPDRVLGELATSVAKYVERLASDAYRPWDDASFVLHCTPLLREMLETLHLARDESASDETYVLAVSQRHALHARLRGTDWQTGHTLYCRDHDALFEAIAACSAVARGRDPAWRCSVASGHPSLSEQRVEVAQAPSVEAVEARLAASSRASVPTLEGGALHLMPEGRIEAYGVSPDDGSLTYELSLGSDGGRYREFFVPWPE